MRKSKAALIALITSTVLGCGTAPPKPSVITETKTKAVTLPDSYYVMGDIPEPKHTPQEFKRLNEREQLVSLGELNAKLYAYIAVVLSRVKTIQTASEAQKLKIEETPNESSKP